MYAIKTENIANYFDLKHLLFGNFDSCEPRIYVGQTDRQAAMLSRSAAKTDGLGPADFS